MFVTRRALVAVFVVGFGFCLTFIAFFDPFDVQANLGTFTNSVIKLEMKYEVQANFAHM